MLEYQRVIANINLDNIANNVKEICKKIKEDKKVMVVVKADGYGHGALEVAKTCLYNGASWLGVAICEEGVHLRKNNIFEPILILGPTIKTNFQNVINYNLTQAIFSYEMAKDLSDAAKSLKKQVDIHIKIDTGMGRVGFLPKKETIEEIDKISKLPFINITGIFTHFASSDAKDKSFAKEQFEKFKYILNELEKRGVKNLIKHASNSASILDLDEFSLDMVRAGIIVYGILPSGEIKNKINILPAMSLKTHISFLKEVEKGQSIGYGRTYFTDKKTKVATVPVGYADGYSRLLSNKAKVIVRGQYANVIGNICMDQMMIDVTHIKDVSTKDSVTLLGFEKDASITADDLAKLQQTISYEIVCGISKRIPRVYTKNGKTLKTVCF